MDIIIWNKTNALPLFNNKYLSDKEYCLYFRKGEYCSPKSVSVKSFVEKLIKKLNLYKFDFFI